MITCDNYYICSAWFLDIRISTSSLCGIKGGIFAASNITFAKVKLGTLKCLLRPYRINVMFLRIFTNPAGREKNKNKSSL